jgi:hypothetical protein
MAGAFVYPDSPHMRRHGPQGYADYESYRPWLRDECTFRCVYCLQRERWTRVTQAFNIDHVSPQSSDPQAVTEYDNLVYACSRCNGVKGNQEVGDPLETLISESLKLLPSGVLEPVTAEAARLVTGLDLNSPLMVQWRLNVMRIVQLAQEYGPELYLQLLGFPEDLPNLSRRRPPSGNARPQGIRQSYFAKRKRGELPDTY